MDYQASTLTNCDRELIHIPGQIQSHGFIIVVNSDYIIGYYSANITDFIKGIPINIIGQHVSYIAGLISKKDEEDFITPLLNLGKAQNTFYPTNPFAINIDYAPFNVIISTTGNNYLIEFEPATSDNKMDVQKMIGMSISQMLSDKTIEFLLQYAAKQVKQVINYDRVMIYRFAEDGHGEVVAEAKEDTLDPWLGLHYPASDIPKQAKELYKINLTRIISDVHTIPSKIITEATNPLPLDLTYAQLRAVSPIHVQYLINMGVASSFSISLLCKNELWGLIACHNYTPRFIDFQSRESSKLIGQVLSSALEFMQHQEKDELQGRYKDKVHVLTQYLLRANSITESLTKEVINIMDITDATGAVLMYEKEICTIGNTPDDEQLAALKKWVKENIKAQLFHTTGLVEIYPAAAEFKAIASGLLLFVISKELDEYIMWFKPEILKTIKWAGNPDKPMEGMKDGIINLSPRHSFAAWSQNVSGTSKAWGMAEIAAVIMLKEEVLHAINVKASAIRLLNEKLNFAYEELDTFGYTISHDLKNPITAIKGYTELLSMDTSINKDVLKIINRIGERANKMDAMVNDVLKYTHLNKSDIKYNKIDIETIVKDIIKDLDLESYKQEIEISLGDLPPLYGDRVMITQVFSNLLSNAVKYSGHSRPALIHVSGSVVGNKINYTVTDNGLGIAPENMKSIFELFNRMDNARHIEGSGVGLAIVKRIVEKHNGQIWAESQLGIGTTLYMSFNNQMPLTPIT